MSILTLSGRTALITGGASGIGYATAKMMGENGMRIALADLNADKLEEAAGRLRDLGCDVFAVPCDVSDEGSISDMTEAVAARFGGIDALVNSAGILSAAGVSDVSREEWDRMLAVNLTGAFFVIQKALPYLKNSRAGRIINISSNSGRMGGFEGSVSYVASKGGVISITYGLARRLAPYGITVNAVCPGTIRTPMVGEFTPAALERLLGRIPLGRLGEPEDVAAAICYLASEEAGYVTGLMLDVNGGMYMG